MTFKILIDGKIVSAKIHGIHRDHVLLRGSACHKGRLYSVWTGSGGLWFAKEKVR
jgi:hypothetical protein